MAKKGVEVNLCWGKNIIQSEWQKKVFKDELSAIEFFKKHSESIQWINKCRTNGNLMSDHDMIRAINNPEDYFGEVIIEDRELMEQWEDN